MRYYIGPYARCLNLVGEKELLQAGCSNCKTEFQSKNFCDKCGSPRSAYKIIKKRELVSHWDMTADDRLFVAYCEEEKYNGSFFDKYLYYAPNMGLDDIRRTMFLHPNDDVPHANPITDSDMKSEIAAFEGQYAKEIDALKKAYSLDNVVVQWGLLAMETR